LFPARATRSLKHGQLHKHWPLMNRFRWIAF